MSEARDKLQTLKGLVALINKLPEEGRPPELNQILKDTNEIIHLFEVLDDGAVNEMGTMMGAAVANKGCPTSVIFAGETRVMLLDMRKQIQKLEEEIINLKAGKTEAPVWNPPSQE